MNYTYIEIRKVAPSNFQIYDNTTPNPTVAEAYRGIINQDSTLTINRENGHPIYNHLPWQIVRYRDYLNDNNSFDPVSAIDLQSKLIARGFYMDSDIEMPVDVIDQDNIKILKTVGGFET